jgi:hypothetical protein
MPYKIAGIDVHKKMLAVVSDVEIDGAVLEAGLGNTGALLEAKVSEVGRRGPNV